MKAPLIEKLPMSLECEAKSFEDGFLTGKIVNVCCDEKAMTDGRIDPEKLKPIMYDPCNNTYIGAGKVCGKAFHDGLELK